MSEAKAEGKPECGLPASMAKAKDAKTTTIFGALFGAAAAAPT